MTSVNIPNLVKALSNERLQPYRKSGETDEVALERYRQNILLSEAFYPSLHMLEIVLRNNIEGVLLNTYGTAWYKSPKLFGLMHNRDGTYSSEGDQLRKAQDKLKRVRKAVTSGRVVAELNFGFWTGLLDRRYEKVIWVKNDHLILPYAQPIDRDVKTIRVDLRNIRRLRNRIAHHEPIWNDPDLYTKYQAIRRFVRWLNADAETWLGRCDRYDDVYQRVYTPRATN